MTQAKKCAARRKAGLKCAKSLRAAGKEMSAYLSACRDMNDGSGDESRGISDGRHILIREMSEYATYLESKYEDKP
jgi:hypothetical protein